MGRGTCIIKDDSGVEHKATTSLIISASRKTDIPAHFSKNFMDRLRRGYLKVTFPKTRYISFDDTRLIVFWTKNPQPLLGYLDEIDAMGINYYFQFTLNDYEDEGLEPNLPALGERIETFKAISAKIGKERVIWRFDPLILTDTISPAKIVRKAGQLMKHLHPYTEKLVISFLKASKHKKVERSLTKAGIRYRDFSADEIAYIADALGRMGKQHGVQVMACSESMDLTQYGIGRNKCIDNALVRKLFGHEKDLVAFANSGKILKDTGQRPLCGCIPSLDVGTYDTCRHFCTYCYANHSEDAVENKINRISSEDDLLVPDAMD
jgi:DNA repair photolyase